MLLPRCAPIASLLLLLWAGAWIGLGSGGCSTGPALNVATDRDGDGLPDTIRVGDFDGDGVLEMDDLQSAMDALTDPGPKQLDVVPGSFAPPAAPASRPGRTHALLELRSFTTLQCSGPGFTILRGGPLAAGQDYAVVANDDHSVGNDEVWIRRCEIDGGAPPSFDASNVPRSRRAGVFFRKTRRSGVADSFVHDTLHTGLYTSNSTGDMFLRNVVEDAGSYGDTGGVGRQPCIYQFAFGGGGVVADFQAIGNTLRRCGHSGLNTRASDAEAAGDVIRNTLWEDNTVEQATHACMNLRGVDGITVRNLTCRSTGAILLNRGFGTGYRWQGNDNANSNVVIEDAVSTNVDTGQVGLDLGGFVDGLRVRRLRIEHTRDPTGAALPKDCAWIERPLRDAVIEDVELHDCGWRGLVVSTRAGGLGDATETLQMRRIGVSEVDQVDPLDTAPFPGILFEGAHARLQLEDLTLAGATGPELAFGGALSNSALRRVEIDSTDPGWLGAFTEASAPACNAARDRHWLTNVNGSSATDCSFGGGTGALRVRCGCRSGSWSVVTWGAASGIDLPLGVTHSNDVLEDVSVTNARGVTGVRVRGVLSSFSVRTIFGGDDGTATDSRQRSAIDFDAASGFSVTGATCVGTQAGVPCVE
jgi:hypothetical protein